VVAKKPEKHAEFLKKLGDRIVSLRKKKGLSQEELAFDCGWDRTNLKKIEKGKMNVTVKTLFKLCEGLGISFRELTDI